MDFFEKTCFKESDNKAVKKSHSNNKLLEKITSSSYHMEQKSSKQDASIMLQTGEKIFAAAASEVLGVV